MVVSLNISREVISQKFFQLPTFFDKIPKKFLEFFNTVLQDALGIYLYMFLERNNPIPEQYGPLNFLINLT